MPQTNLTIVTSLPFLDSNTLTAGNPLQNQPENWASNCEEQYEFPVTPGQVITIVYTSNTSPATIPGTLSGCMDFAVFDNPIQQNSLILGSINYYPPPLTPGPLNWQGGTEPENVQFTDVSSYGIHSPLILITWTGNGIFAPYVATMVWSVPSGIAGNVARFSAIGGSAFGTGSQYTLSLSSGSAPPIIPTVGVLQPVPFPLSPCFSTLKLKGRC